MIIEFLSESTRTFINFSPFARCDCWIANSQYIYRRISPGDKNTYIERDILVFYQ